MSSKYQPIWTRKKMFLAVPLQYNTYFPLPKQNQEKVESFSDWWTQFPTFQVFNYNLFCAPHHCTSSLTLSVPLITFIKPCIPNHTIQQAWTKNTEPNLSANISWVWVKYAFYFFTVMCMKPPMHDGIWIINRRSFSEIRFIRAGVRLRILVKLKSSKA